MLVAVFVLSTIRSLNTAVHRSRILRRRDPLVPAVQSKFAIELFVLSHVKGFDFGGFGNPFAWKLHVVLHGLVEWQQRHTHQRLP